MPPPPRSCCSVRDCPVVIHARRLMCDRHWGMVPEDVKLQLSTEFKEGQGKKVTTTTGWDEAVKWAIEHVEKMELQERQQA